MKGITFPQGINPEQGSGFDVCWSLEDSDICVLYAAVENVWAVIVIAAWWL